MTWFRAILTLAFSLVAIASAEAHPESLSSVRVTVGLQKTHAALSLQVRDLSRWFPPARYADYVPQVIAELQRADVLQLQFDDLPPPTPQRVSARAGEEGTIVIDLDFPPPPPTTHALAVWSTVIVNLPNDHQQFLTVEDARGGSNVIVALAEETLNAQQDAWSGDLPKAPEPKPAASTQPTTRISPAERAAAAKANGDEGGRPTSFFLLGIEHILTGYDHLLFLGALLIACQGFKDAAKVITLFTVAHSITLALAALDVVRLSGQIVEPLIAASIIYVAVENIFLRDKLKWRNAVVFGFGLIHGLGFASVLRELGLGSNGLGVVLPLLKFNLGVEAGQLAVAAVLLPLILSVKDRPSYTPKWRPALSILIGVIGAYWLVERVISNA